MIAIPNMEKPKSCDVCRILRAEFDGSYDKPITGCRQKMGKKNTLQEEWDALIPDCPLIDIVTCGECKHRDPEDKKCDCGMFERQGCIFPVADDYFCKYGERRTDEHNNKRD